MYLLVSLENLQSLLAVDIIWNEEFWLTLIIFRLPLTSLSMTEAFFANVVKLENFLLIDVA